ncbi:MerR family transcriptional regulator [Cellulomonas endophytica]|uniref:MerR family transcriptional regulator n=1 Tax=Cellulomonas endophytica TaxID=2494735 RepID=UPI0010132024|nr:MerR family transcriptional regulator [Cellulomonas endophytica]
MRISELSSRTGVSAPLIKFYVREGLLPAAERTGHNRTEYDEQHVARLVLIRSLVDVGGLSLAAARRVLDAIDDADLPLAEVLGVAQGALPRPAAPATPESLDRVRAVTTGRGWHVHDDNPGLEAAAAVLDGWARVGRGDLAAGLERYAQAAAVVAEADLDAVEAIVQSDGDRSRAAETVVVGTVLGDTLMAGLRRMAQEDASVRRYGGGPPDDHVPAPSTRSAAAGAAR